MVKNHVKLYLLMLMETENMYHRLIIMTENLFEIFININIKHTHLILISHFSNLRFNVINKFPRYNLYAFLVFRFVTNLITLSYNIFIRSNSYLY